MIDNYAEVAAAHEEDDLLFGTIESWLAYVRMSPLALWPIFWSLTSRTESLWRGRKRSPHHRCHERLPNAPPQPSHLGVGAVFAFVFRYPAVCPPQARVNLRGLWKHCLWSAKGHSHRWTGGRSAGRAGGKQVSECWGSQVYIWNRCVFTVLHGRQDCQERSWPLEHGLQSSYLNSTIRY